MSAHRFGMALVPRGRAKQDGWEFDGRERLPQVTFPLQRVSIDHNRLRVDLLGERIGMFEEPK